MGHTAASPDWDDGRSRYLVLRQHMRVVYGDVRTKRRVGQNGIKVVGNDIARNIILTSMRPFPRRQQGIGVEHIG